jgi:hypothetical protein
MASRVTFLLLTLLLAACTAPQPSAYAPKASRDGYAEELLGKGLYRVSFQGNSVTSRERTEDYALFRAAELTLELGAEKFAVHDRLTERLTKVTRETYDPWGRDPFYYGRYGYRQRSFGYRPTFHSEVTTFQAELTVEPFSGPEPDGGFQVHDAAAVIARFAPQIVRPADDAE